MSTKDENLFPHLQNFSLSSFSGDRNSLDLARYSNWDAPKSYSNDAFSQKKSGNNPSKYSSAKPLSGANTPKVSSNCPTNLKSKSSLVSVKKTRIASVFAAPTDPDGEGDGSTDSNLQRIMERIRAKAKADMLSNTVPGLDETVDNQNQTDGETASMHMMKVKFRILENDLDKVARQAAHSIQEVDQKTSQLDTLQKNLKNMKAFDAHQTHKLQQLIKQSQEAKKIASHLEKELDRLTPENAALDKDEKEREKDVPNVSSVNRLVSMNGSMKAEIQQLKDANKTLIGSNQKVQQQILDHRRRYQLECKRFVNAIHKLNLLVDFSEKEKNHLEASKLIQFAENERRHFYQKTL